MATQEALNKESMLAIVGEAFGSQPRDKGKKESLRLRKERRTAFLETADALLQGYGYDHIQKGEQPQRLTRPIDLLIDDHVQEQFTLQLQISRSSTTVGSVFAKNEKRYTDILATDPRTGIKYTLFGIEENYDEYTRYGEKPPLRINRYTTIRNQRGTLASNQDLLKGLQAINFIGDQLANQPTPTSTM